MSEKDKLIDNILNLEWNMFINVQSRFPASCQENHGAFRLHRGAQFSVWSEEILHSYLDDLCKAKEQSKNLMTLKYARMENLIPPLNSNPIIAEIVQLETEAQNEMLLRYPKIMRKGRPIEDDSISITSFKTYLQGELETYSDRTLELLRRDIQQTSEKGENWVKYLYDNLFRNLGYASLDEAEKVISDHDS